MMDEAQMQKLEAGALKYGAAEAHKYLGRVKRPERKPASPALVVGTVIVPWFIFIITFYAMSFFIRYWAWPVAYFIAFIMFGACLGFGGMAYAASQGKGGDTLWLGLLCLLSLIGWAWACIGSMGNFEANMQPYFDLQQLNVYQQVDPGSSESSQYMDFGIIRFVEHAHIDRAFSMAFKNEDTYCVAPVKVNMSNPTNFDYWAVGINCCTSHLYDFRCGQWNNPAAHSGLRIVRESVRSFYQLATKQAAAAYNIPVKHPIFFEWVTDPSVQLAGYQAAGFSSMLNNAWYFFCVEVVAVVIAAWAFANA